MKTKVFPSLDSEFEILESGIKYVAGVDEVGRGALAGPVMVGVVVIDNSVNLIPDKLRDSKLISKQVRQELVPRIRQWVSDYSIGQASAAEIDEIGIVRALGLAFSRAYQKLKLKPEFVILDGKHNWIATSNLESNIPVAMKIKADQLCASVAAASVLAKVERDQLMCAISDEYPKYGFAGNVGYGSAKHMDAIREFGVCDLHRKSWKLPTTKK